MGFNSMVKKAYAGGALTAYTAPLAAYKGSVIALATKVTGSVTSTAGLVVTLASPTFNIEWESLSALIETNITTTSLVVKMIWQASLDGTNWVQLYDSNGVAPVQIAATGSGSLVTTQFIMNLHGINPGYPYLRIAALNTGATGAAGDNVTAAYNYRGRFTWG
jgi:hypothetical protein